MGRKTAVLLAVLSGLCAAGCSALLDTDGVQCKTDRDCAMPAKGSGAPLVCKKHVCTEGAPNDGGAEARLPFVVDEVFFASGYVGDGETQLLTEGVCPKGQRAGEGRGLCHKFVYEAKSASVGWGGVHWQYPANNWELAPGYIMPKGAHSVSFYAWASAPQPPVRFSVGILQADGFEVRTDEIALTTTPTRHLIDISAEKYTDVVGAFSFSVLAPSEGVFELYLDDIIWTDQRAQVATTFEVDMRGGTPLKAGCGVRLLGSFNGWDSSKTMMTDADADGVYSASVELTPEEKVQYRFATVCDKVVATEKLPVGADCAGADVDGAPARELTVPDEPTTIKSVCFSSCVACSFDGEVPLSLKVTDMVLDRDGSALLDVLGRYEDRTEPITVGPTFVSADPTVVGVTDTGVVTGRAPGSTTVAVRLFDLAAQAKVAVRDIYSLLRDQSQALSAGAYLGLWTDVDGEVTVGSETQRSFEGKSSVRVDYTGKTRLGGIFVGTPMGKELDLSVFKGGELVFALLAEPPLDSLVVQLESGGVLSKVDVADYTGTSVRGWLRYRIPLSDFVTADLSMLSAPVGFWHPNEKTTAYAGTILYDDVYFVRPTP